MKNKFFFGQDNKNKWYLIPIEQRQEWLKWIDNDCPSCLFSERLWQNGWEIEGPEFYCFDKPHDLRYPPYENRSN